jgi:hypothetical protein
MYDLQRFVDNALTRARALLIGGDESRAQTFH